MFWALLASGQIVMRKLDGWQTLSQKQSDRLVDVAARSDNVITREIAPNKFQSYSTAPFAFLGPVDHNANLNFTPQYS
jgi:hypothetical protein